MKGIGILLNEEFDLITSNQRGGDGKLTGFEVGRTIHQNSAVILVHNPGQIKERPLLGVGVNNMLLDDDIMGWRRKIRLALEADGQDVTGIRFSENKIEVDGEYIN